MILHLQGLSGNHETKTGRRPVLLILLFQGIVLQQMIA